MNAKDIKTQLIRPIADTCYISPYPASTTTFFQGIFPPEIITKIACVTTTFILMCSKESQLYLIPNKVSLIGAQFRIYDGKQKMQHSINSVAFKRRFWALKPGYC